MVQNVRCLDCVKWKIFGGGNILSSFDTLFWSHFYKTEFFTLESTINHYKKTAYLRRPWPLTNSPKPSLSSDLLAANWRPKGVRKTSVGKCSDGLGRQKWKRRILWRPGSPVPNNGQNLRHWLATAWAVSNFELVTAQAVTTEWRPAKLTHLCHM
jgi:hypothetical protein